MEPHPYARRLCRFAELGPTRRSQLTSLEGPSTLDRVNRKPVGRGAAWATPNWKTRPGTVGTPSVRSSWIAVKRRLWREGRLVPITSKTFDVLVVLLEHRDHIVSKDELLNRVWPTPPSTKTIWRARYRLCGGRLANVPTSTISSSPSPVTDIDSSPACRTCRACRRTCTPDHEVHLHAASPEPLDAPRGSWRR